MKDFDYVLSTWPHNHDNDDDDGGEEKEDEDDADSDDILGQQWMIWLCLINLTTQSQIPSRII